MLLAENDVPETASKLRLFGWVTALILALAAWRVESPYMSTSLRMAAGFLFVIGTIWPSTLRRPKRILSALTLPGRWVVSEFLLATTYYGVLTPIGIGLRLLRKEAQQMRSHAEASTYWQTRAPNPDANRYFRQF